LITASVNLVLAHAWHARSAWTAKRPIDIDKVALLEWA